MKFAWGMEKLCSRCVHGLRQKYTLGALRNHVLGISVYIAELSTSVHRSPVDAESPFYLPENIMSELTSASTTSIDVHHSKGLYDLIIVGAGPAGLSCAIEAQDHGLSALVIDKGSLCDCIRRFPNDMQFYSTPELLEIGSVPFCCANVRPSRVEVLQYYRRVAEVKALNLALHTRVLRVSKTRSGYFELECEDGLRCARNVVIATGYFDTTNTLDCEGEHLEHVHPYYTEAFMYTGMKVVVVGGKNSAVETALDLWRHGAQVHLVHRGSSLADSVKYWQKPDMENRLRAGEILATFSSRVVAIRVGEVEIENIHSKERSILEADFVIPHIGYRPDAGFLASCGVDFDPQSLVASIDKETFESTSMPGLYLAGSVLCGCKAWNIFIENGREHARPIIQSITQKSLS